MPKSYVALLGLVLIGLSGCGRSLPSEEVDPNAYFVDEETQKGLNSLLSRAVVTEEYKCPTNNVVECAEIVKKNIAKFVEEHPETQTIKAPKSSSRGMYDGYYPNYPYGPYYPPVVNRFYNPYGTGVAVSGCGVAGCGVAGAGADVYGAGAGFLYSGTYGFAGGGIRCGGLILGCVGVVGANGYGAAGYCGAFGCFGTAW